ncbi:MAG: DUF6428 family protein [Bacteroidota bacterium]
MRLSEIKTALSATGSVNFQLPDGSAVPSHFHVTEIGIVNKRFIDCGGTLRDEKVINFQLWEANDYDHRITPDKMNQIIKVAETKLGLDDLDVEVEYQSDTIGTYSLDFTNGNFQLLSKRTNCLAKDKCGVPSEKPRVRLSNIRPKAENTCVPGTGCC